MKISALAPLIIAGPAVMVAPLQAQTRYDHGDPTVYEQLMLEMINRARANPAAEAARLGIGLNDGLAAGTISPDPKPPYTFHPLLINAARGHTAWMLSSGTFSHTGAGGSSPGDRMTAAGYVFSGSSGWGENIAWGGTSGTVDVLAHTIARHDELFRSSGHRTNICDDFMRDTGLGIQVGAYKQLNALMATQKFARSGSYADPKVTGVVFEDRDGDAFYDPGEGLAGVTVVPEGGGWEAVTSASGGYAVPYAGSSGTLAVTFSGGPVSRPIRRTVTRTGENVKMDLSSVVVPFMEIVPGSAAYSEALGFSLQVTGTAGVSFRLQHSTDLTGWLDVSSHRMEAAAMTLTHSPAPELKRGFYRIQW